MARKQKPTEAGGTATLEPLAPQPQEQPAPAAPSLGNTRRSVQEIVQELANHPEARFLRFLDGEKPRASEIINGAPVDRQRIMDIRLVYLAR